MGCRQSLKAIREEQELKKPEESIHLVKLTRQKKHAIFGSQVFRAFCCR